MNVNITFVVGGVVGAVIGFAGTMLSAFITRKSEDRRHFRELGVQVAMEKFKQHAAVGQQLANLKHEMVEIPPFESFLVYGIRVMEIVSDTSLSADEISTKLKAVASFTVKTLRKE